MSHAPAPAAPRNAPCPCGSGKRYKDCHGALDAPSSAATAEASFRLGNMLHARGEAETTFGHPHYANNRRLRDDYKA